MVIIDKRRRQYDKGTLLKSLNNYQPYDFKVKKLDQFQRLQIFDLNSEKIYKKHQINY